MEPKLPVGCSILFDRFLELGVSKSVITRLSGMSKPTLYHFIATRGLNPGTERAY